MKHKIIFILAILILSSCKKNTESEQYEILTKAPWKLVSVMDDGIEVIDPCEMDDVYTFESEKLYIDDGTVKCLEDNDVYKPAKWKFEKEGQIIKMPKLIVAENNSSGVIAVEKFEIIELNDSIFKVKWDGFE